MLYSVYITFTSQKCHNYIKLYNNILQLGYYEIYIFNREIYKRLIQKIVKYFTQDTAVKEKKVQLRKPAQKKLPAASKLYRKKAAK